MSRILSNSFFSTKYASTILRSSGIAGCVGVISYSLYMLLFKFDFLLAFMYIYLSLIAVSLVSAELGAFANNRYQAYFLLMTTATGRGFVYILMGGLLLSGWGIPVAAYVILIGLMNIAFSFHKASLPDAANGVASNVS